MRHVRDVLTKVYTEKARRSDEHAALARALAVAVAENFSADEKKILQYAAVYTYERGLLTLSLPRECFVPDIRFFSDRLQKAIHNHTGKQIRAVRYIPT